MRNLFTALLCLSLCGFASAQATGGTTSQQHATTEKSAQTSTEPTAIFETTDGNITCTLFPDKAPLTVANFIGLATGTKDWKDPKTGKMVHGVPLYNGTIFHRVIPDFMIQGGDPVGNGSGDPGYSFKDEFSPDLTFDQPGRLAMANSGPGTNGSQFFITEVPTPHLNNHHTIFGQCQDIDVVKKIARLAADPRTDRPYDPAKIIRIKIIDPRHPGAATGAKHKPAGSSTPSDGKKTTTPPSQ
jgi:peptidyl-prolyl cis-trans isomerase A (cyclophilin A)